MDNQISLNLNDLHLVRRIALLCSFSFLELFVYHFGKKDRGRGGNYHLNYVIVNSLHCMWISSEQ